MGFHLLSSNDCYWRVHANNQHDPHRPWNHHRGALGPPMRRLPHEERKSIGVLLRRSVQSFPMGALVATMRSCTLSRSLWTPARRPPFPSQPQSRWQISPACRKPRQPAAWGSKSNLARLKLRITCLPTKPGASTVAGRPWLSKQSDRCRRLPPMCSIPTNAETSFLSSRGCRPARGPSWLLRGASLLCTPARPRTLRSPPSVPAITSSLFASGTMFTPTSLMGVESKPAVEPLILLPAC